MLSESIDTSVSKNGMGLDSSKSWMVNLMLESIHPPLSYTCHGNFGLAKKNWSRETKFVKKWPVQTIFSRNVWLPPEKNGLTYAQTSG